MRAFGKLLSLSAINLVLLSCVFIDLSVGDQSSQEFYLYDLMTRGNSVIRGDPAGGGPEWDDIIIEVIKTGNLEQLKPLMDKGGGANARHKGGASALRWAAIYGHRDIVLFLLERGAKVNMEQGGTLEEQLISSTILGKSEEVAKLLAHGADVNAAAEIGDTALHWASVMGETPLVKTLVERGARVNSVSRNHATPLALAALQGHADIVRFLLDCGADLELGSPPALLASAKGHTGIARLLEQHKKKAEVSDRRGEKAIIDPEPENKPSIDVVPFLSPGLLKWLFVAKAGYVTIPTVVDRTAYFFSNTDEDSQTHSCLHAVEVNTGQEIWRLDVQGSVVVAPTIAQGVAYFGSREGQTGESYALAVDLETKQEKWKFKAKGQAVWISAIVDGVVYFGTFGGYVYAVDAETGQEKWRYTTETLDGGNQGSVSNLTVDDATFFFGTGPEVGDDRGPGFGYLVALDARTGREKWRSKLWDSATALAVRDGMVYAGSEDGCIYALDATTGSEKWRFCVRNDSAKTARVIHVKTYSNAAYMTTLNGPPGFYTKDAHVFAIDLKSGGKMWKAKTEARLLGPVTLLNGKIYVPGDDGHLYIFDSETGELRSKFRYQVDNESRLAAIKHGVLFCAGNGTLCAIDLSSIPFTEEGIIPTPLLSETSPAAPQRKRGSAEVTSDGSVSGRGVRLQTAQRREESRGTQPLPQESSDIPSFTSSRMAKQLRGLKWRIRVGDWFSSPIVVSNGLAFFFPGNSRLVAVEAQTGRESWRVPNSWQPDVAAGDGLLLFREGRCLYGVDIKTRQVKWKQTEWTSGRIVAEEGVIVTETADGFICGLDMATGAEKWRFVQGHRLHRPSVADGKVFTVASENVIYGLDLKTGRQRWKHELEGTVRIFTAISDGVIYFGSWNGETFFCRALEIKTKREKWKLPCEAISAHPAIGERAVCFPSSDCLYGVDKETGKLLWRFKADGLSGAPVIAGGRVYFRDRKSFYALDLTTGQPTWQVSLGGEMSHSYDVAIADGVVYFGSNDGYLYAVDIRAAERKD